MYEVCSKDCLMEFMPTPTTFQDLGEQWALVQNASFKAILEPVLTGSATIAAAKRWKEARFDEIGRLNAIVRKAESINFLFPVSGSTGSTLLLQIIKLNVLLCL